MSYFDTRINQCELEVQRIIHLQNLANQLSYAFINTKKVTKSHTLAANAPSRIDVLKGQLENESKIRLKLGRPIVSKDITPKKRRIQRRIDNPEEVHDKKKKKKAPVETYIEPKTSEEVRDKKNIP